MVDDGSALLEAGVADAESIVEEGFVTVEVAFAAVLLPESQYGLMATCKVALTYLARVSLGFCVLLPL